MSRQIYMIFFLLQETHRNDTDGIPERDWDVETHGRASLLLQGEMDRQPIVAADNLSLYGRRFPFGH